MAYLFRPTYTSKKADGSRATKKARTWYGDYTDGDGVRRRVKLSPNKTAAQQMLAELVKRAELEKAGVRDPYRDHRTAAVDNALTAFGRHLADKGSSERHAAETLARCRRAAEACGFATLADLTDGPVTAWLADLRRVPRGDGGIGAATSNHVVTALKSFGNWLVRDRRAAENPFRHLTKVNAAADVRHKRRPLTADESLRLLAAARAGGPFRGLTGPDRATLYLVAAGTGLRASELASLTPGSFALDADPPTVTVEAAYSKHRRRDVVPLHPDLVPELRTWLADRPAGERLWPGKWAENFEAVDLIRRDLAAAGVPYRNAAGEVVDFHALRHTFVTDLVRAGVLPKDAQALARHSTITLTMDRYAHTTLKESAAAVAKVPGLAERAGASGGASGPLDEAKRLEIKLSDGETDPALNQRVLGSSPRRGTGYNSLVAKDFGRFLASSLLFVQRHTIV